MTRLLVVDDSALIRRLLSDIFGSTGEFEVATARGGAEALQMLTDFAPEVITLDVHMHDMDGLTCLDRIMVLRPTPVVMVSSLTSEGAEETLEAMSLGAVDFVAKPRGALSLEIDAIADALVDKVRAAAKAHVPRALRLRERVRALHAGKHAKPPAGAAITRKVAGSRPVPPPVSAPLEHMTDTGVVLVGCSTGGPQALDVLLGDLPETFPWPVVIAQHMPGSFTGPLARRLDRIGGLAVHEVTRTTPLAPGNAYIGKGDADLILSRRGGKLVAMPAPSSAAHFWHPSVDRLVESAMRVVAPEKLIGVLMTGMGSDGASAMSTLHAMGGQTIAEAESTAVIWGMPGALVARSAASCVCPLDDIVAELSKRLPSA